MKKISEYSFEVGAIRPPSEGGSNSLLLRITRNCPWGRCTFCYASFYDREKFQLRTVDAIKADIDSVKAISDEIRRVSWQIGCGGKVNNLVGMTMLQEDPALGVSVSFSIVYSWLASGAHTAFLQDADSLIMRTPDLVEVINYLKTEFPSLDRITSYARAKTLFHKTLVELKSIRASGLTRLHVGLETGDDELLKYVDKGITSEQNIIAGKKVKEAGFELSEYVMPGLGGRAMADQHARNTARVLNAINPDYVRFRPFVPRPGTPLYEDYKNGKFELSTARERLIELRTLLTELDVTSQVCFDHAMNFWRSESGDLLFKQDYEGYKFPEEKHIVLALIDTGLYIDERLQPDISRMIELIHL